MRAGAMVSLMRYLRCHDLCAWWLMSFSTSSFYYPPWRIELPDDMCSYFEMCVCSKIFEKKTTNATNARDLIAVKICMWYLFFEFQTQLAVHLDAE